MLQQLHLEIVLRSKRLAVSAREPLSQLIVAGSHSSWCATWSDIWKWIQFGDTKPETKHGGSVKENDDAA